MANAAAIIVKPSEFVSRGLTCRGDLFMPEGVERPPVVVMAHGFGAERTFGLPAFAERFAGDGLAVFLFDYRCFGDSDGEPRNWVSPARHCRDWQAAIAHVRSLKEVDGGRVALWGSSFSGGHVIVTAAREAGISAVCIQVPFVDPFSSIRMLGLRFLAEALPRGALDIACMATGHAPHWISLVGRPSEFAVMNTPEAWPGYMAIVPEETGWKNRCPARILLSFSLYRPMSYASRVRCPALVMLAEKDSLIDAAAVAKTAGRMPLGELVRYPIGHFDIYNGKAFDRAVEKQTTFLCRHLR